MAKKKASAFKAPKGFAKFTQLVPNRMEQNYHLSQAGFSNGEVAALTGASSTNVSRDKWAFNMGYKKTSVPVTKTRKLLKA